MSKIFIIGLPRTGTTSACVALLHLDYKVAHCSVTEASLLAADAIGDTPAYCDYKSLDKRFPGSRFIYMERSMDSWLPSIKTLLKNMITGLNIEQGGFSPVVKRCYKEVFQPINHDTIDSDQHLSFCYTQHRNSVLEYFQGREADFITLDISHANAYQQMVSFLGARSTRETFPRMNVDGQIVSWREYQHRNKIRFNL